MKKTPEIKTLTNERKSWGVMAAMLQKTLGLYFHCGFFKKYECVFWFLKKTCFEMIVKVFIIIIMIMIRETIMVIKQGQWQ